MDAATVSLAPAGDDLAYVERLLERNDLPAADVHDGRARFYVATDGEDPVGVGGLEAYGDAGLLRSVVVEEAARGNGYGVAICEAVEAEASGAGVETLYLLTTTAAGFFADRGFERVERADAPASIRQTTEFADLCPDSATCMRKSL